VINKRAANTTPRTVELVDMLPQFLAAVCRQCSWRTGFWHRWSARLRPMNTNGTWVTVMNGSAWLTAARSLRRTSPRQIPSLCTRADKFRCSDVS